MIVLVAMMIYGLNWDLSSQLINVVQSTVRQHIAKSFARDCGHGDTGEESAYTPLMQNALVIDQSPKYLMLLHDGYKFKHIQSLKHFLFYYWETQLRTSINNILKFNIALKQLCTVKCSIAPSSLITTSKGQLEMIQQDVQFCSSGNIADCNNLWWCLFLHPFFLYIQTK